MELDIPVEVADATAVVVRVASASVMVVAGFMVTILVTMLVMLEFEAILVKDLSRRDAPMMSHSKTCKIGMMQR